jgi:hypothetical protein
MQAALVPLFVNLRINEFGVRRKSYVHLSDKDAWLLLGGLHDAVATIANTAINNGNGLIITSHTLPVTGHHAMLNQRKVTSKLLHACTA